jgi:hypothetical protein
MFDTHALWDDATNRKDSVDPADTKLANNLRSSMAKMERPVGDNELVVAKVEV